MAHDVVSTIYPALYGGLWGHQAGWALYRRLSRSQSIILPKCVKLSGDSGTWEAKGVRTAPAKKIYFHL